MGMEEEQMEKSNAYTPRDIEKHLYHVELEKRIFDKMTGEKKSKPFIQMFTKAEWPAFKERAARLGYNHVEVLWEPKK